MSGTTHATTTHAGAMHATTRHAGAAPAPRRVLAQVGFEARALLTRGEQILLSLVLPAIALVVLTQVDAVGLGATEAERIDVVAPGVLAMAVLATSFTATAIATAFDRRAGVLRLLAVTPLGPGGLLAGKAGAVLVVQVVQILVLGGAAAVLGWRPDPAGIPAAVLAVALATIALTALGLLLAGMLRAEAVLGLANLVFILLVAGGAVLTPAETLPGALQDVAPFLPSGALGEALRVALGTGGFPATSLVVLAAWAALFVLAARRWFRWF